MNNPAAIVRALLGVQITLAGIALALIATDAGSFVLLLALIGFAVTGSALPGPAKTRQATSAEGDHAPADA
jgi:hypothetical protein